MTDWKRVEPQPEMMVLADEYLAFTKMHGGEPVAVVFDTENGATTTDVVDGKRYRLTLVVEEEA